MVCSKTSAGGGQGGGADPTDVAGVVRPPPTLARVGAVGGGYASRVTATFVVIGSGTAGTSSVGDEAFLCVVKSQKCRSNQIYKTELTKIRYKIK